MKKPSPQQIHALFSRQVGAYAIATPVNISAIIAYCISKKPKRVLELGGGIGTLTYCILNYTDAVVEVYEENVFCRGKLLENLDPWSSRISLKESYAQVPSKTEYDLVIIDGPDSETIEKRDKLTFQVLAALENIECIFIEGSRYSQRRLAQRKMADLSSYFIEKVRAREVNALGLVKGGLFVHKASYAPKLVRDFCYLFWLMCDLSDFKDPRRRAKIVSRILAPRKTLARVFRRVRSGLKLLGNRDSNL